MKSDILKLFRTAIGAVDPYLCVKNQLVFKRQTNNIEKISDEQKEELNIEDEYIALNHNLYVAAFGKAALSMCRAVDELCSKHIVKGIASVPVGAIEQAKRDGIYPSWKSPFEIYEGAQNNLPDQAAMKTAQHIEQMITTTMCAEDILLVLISGGGSALLPLPINILSLDEKYQIIKSMQSKGANIKELNTVRQAMSQLKNGGLARKAKAKTIIALILSDVIDDPLEFIASGPTFYSGNKNQAALDILQKYELINRIPSRLLGYLKDNQEITNEANVLSIKKQVHNLIVGSNRIALEAASNSCYESIMCPSFIMTSCLQGEARDIAYRIIELIRTKTSNLDYNDKNACLFSDRHTFDAYAKFVRQHKRYCLLFGGETTVVMKDNVGKGGRCQELALAAALHLNDPNENKFIMLLAAGSDGIDGPTDAAGAFAFTGMINNLKQIQHAQKALDEHDVYTYLSEYNNGENLLKIGHTNTNVMDIIIVFVENKTN